MHKYIYYFNIRITVYRCSFSSFLHLAVLWFFDPLSVEKHITSFEAIRHRFTHTAKQFKQNNKGIVQEFSA